MKRTGPIIFLLVFHQLCCAQQIDLRDLSNLLDMNPAKLQTHLQKKGYRPTILPNDESVPCYMMESKREKCRRGFLFPGENKGFAFTYETTSQEEFTRLEEEIRASGYTSPGSDQDTTARLYQRMDMRVECSRQQVDTSLFYVLKMGRKNLPRKKDIMSAEDLLQLDAQQYLSAVFGPENIRTDRFYFTETETNLCTVLFPGTDREAIFVWNDEKNLKDIAFIVFGGNTQPRSVVTHTAVAQNLWTSKQGVHCGMTLNELQGLNREAVHFYNWTTESAGYLAPENKGALDFKQLGIVFNCMNCGYLKTGTASIIDSELALSQDQKVYVQSYLVLPEKKPIPALSNR